MSVTADSVMTLLNVFDMRKSIAFYCDMLGFQVLEKHEPDGHLYWAMLELGGATIMLNAKFEFDKQPQTPPRADGHGDVELYFYCPSADAVYEQLRSKNFSVAPPVDQFYGYRQVSFKDPDGYHLCFQHSIK